MAASMSTLGGHRRTVAERPPRRPWGFRCGACGPPHWRANRPRDIRGDKCAEANKKARSWRSRLFRISRKTFGWRCSRRRQTTPINTSSARSSSAP